MFRNNTKTAVNRLAAGSMRMSRARNGVVVLAIFLTTWLITSFFSIGMSVVKSFDEQEIKLAGTKAQAVLTAPTEEQLRKTKKLDYVKAVGLQAGIGAADGTSGNPEEAVQMVWYDTAEWNDMRMPAISEWKGTYPAARNEIAVPLDLLRQMGIDKPEIGMSVPLQYNVTADGKPVRHNETFKLTGWFKDYSQLRPGDGGSLLVSEPFMKDSGAAIQTSGTASILFTSKDTEQLIEKLQQDLGLHQGQKLNAVSNKKSLDSGSMATLIGYGGLVLFIMLSGYLLIYNVLYISVAGDARFYGLLKTIGVTRRQIRTMIRKQALRMALIGIPTGLIAGAATSFGIVPMALKTLDLPTGGSLSFHPVIFVGAALFALITTMVSCVKPARVAGKISPIEAAKYTGITPSSKARSGSGASKLHRMALRNIFRIKKLAFVVFLSLFLGLTTFLIINTLVLSMNPEHFVADYMSNDFELSNGSGWNTGDRQAVSPELLTKIKSIPGAKDIRTTYLGNTVVNYDPKVFGEYMDQFKARYMGGSSGEADIEKSPDMLPGYVIGLDPADFREANEKLPSPVNAERFERGEVALLDGDIPAFKTGDRFTMKVNGAAKETELEIGGIASFAGLVRGMAPTVYISQTAMKQILKDPIIYKVSFDADRKDWSAIAEQVKAAITGNSDLKLESRMDMMKLVRSAKLAFYILGGGLSMILALIGLLNFVNITVTGVLARKAELAVLESIGMTSRQIKKLLLLEGAWYALISILLVTAFGNALGYGAFRLFSQEATYAVYTFPAVPLAAVILLVAVVCLTAPVLAYRKVCRSPLAERLREAA
ncbi:ABC transporter permease [Paenibacillus sp. URB8-2]|uniref:ABC transporter permease n=1 Tax=Paenibacillus sp. URB8-2 TaxID=2741301 RepID=UPI0015BF3A4B|nr:FtsX-like permease family protein [Paenibacillus sp. URB8-2]BCG59399.1 efflux ABC transporter permease [Paenibacillus sp. URB8-2]